MLLVTETGGQRVADLIGHFTEHEPQQRARRGQHRGSAQRPGQRAREFPVTHRDRRDQVDRPGQRLAEIAPGLGQTTTLVHASAVMVLLTGLLALTYLAFYALVGLTVDPERYATR